MMTFQWGSWWRVDSKWFFRMSPEVKAVSVWRRDSVIKDKNKSSEIDEEERIVLRAWIVWSRIHSMKAKEIVVEDEDDWITKFRKKSRDIFLSKIKSNHKITKKEYITCIEVNFHRDQNSTLTVLQLFDNEIDTLSSNEIEDLQLNMLQWSHLK